MSGKGFAVPFPKGKSQIVFRKKDGSSYLHPDNNLYWVEIQSSFVYTGIIELFRTDIRFFASQSKYLLTLFLPSVPHT